MAYARLSAILFFTLQQVDPGFTPRPMNFAVKGSEGVFCPSTLLTQHYSLALLSLAHRNQIAGPPGDAMSQFPTHQMPNLREARNGLWETTTPKKKHKAQDGTQRNNKCGIGTARADLALVQTSALGFQARA